MKQKIGLAVFVVLGALGTAIIYMDSLETSPEITDVLSGAALYLIGRDIWKNSKDKLD